MNNPYAQPVYRAAGGAICETEEEAREKSREYYVLKHMAKALRIPKVEECYIGEEGSWTYTQYKAKERKRDQLGWIVSNHKAIISAHKEACEYTDARMKEGDSE